MLFPMLFKDDPPPKLVGIARLAASSDLLEAKRQVEYLELETRRFIGRGSGRMRDIWTLNPYRGCEFGCKYCYARYAHEFMELRDPELFERKIYAKQFHAGAFRAEVRRLKPGDTVWIGTATDPYQPAERRFEITRQILEVFAEERGLDFGITTKSDLVARDAALMARIARKNKIRVHLTITTLDERLARLLEPRAPRPALRLAAVAKLTAAGVPVSVLAHPVMPLINDSEESLDGVCAAAAQPWRVVLQRRSPVPEALCGAGFPAVSRRALPAPGPPLSRAFREDRVSEGPLSRNDRRARGAYPRAAQTGWAAGSGMARSALSTRGT